MSTSILKSFDSKSESRIPPSWIYKRESFEKFRKPKYFSTLDMHDHTSALHLRISRLGFDRCLGGVIGGGRLVPLGRPFEVDFGSLPVEDALVIRRPPGQSGFGEV